jgi:hypothetical protein
MNRFLQYAADKAQLKPEGLRSPKWDKVQKAHLAKEPCCQWCGSKKALNVHHIVPFHVNESLELDDGNLLSACRTCHFSLCHFNNWKLSNPLVKQACKEYSKLKQGVQHG